MNNLVLTSFGRTILDSQSDSKKKLLQKLSTAEDPDENKALSTIDDDCELCQQERLKKPCTICEE